MATEASRKGVTLDHLRVHRFRDVSPETELSFDPEWNVLLGKNGSGKTTLLRLIAAVLTSNTTELQADEFDVSFDMRIAAAHLSCRLKNTRVSDATGSTELAQRTRLDSAITFRLTADVTLKATRFSVAASGGPTGTRVPSGDFLSDRQMHSFWILPRVLIDVLNAEGPHRLDEPSKTELIDILVELMALNDSASRFDEALASFQQLVRRSTSLAPWVQGPTPRVTFVRDRTSPDEAVSSHDEYLSPHVMNAISQQLGNIDPIETPQKQFTASEQTVPFLRHVCEMCDFRTATLQMPLEEKKVETERASVSYGPFAFLFTRRDGSIIGHEHLSYGQKRLLAFMYYLETAPRVVIADELVNGLHYDWIAKAIELMDGRQKFMTSQNPLLLDHLSFTSEEQVARRFIRCTSDDGGLRWFNLPKEDADRFFQSYSAGIQYVGEILRSEGLW